MTLLRAYSHMVPEYCIHIYFCSWCIKKSVCLLWLCFSFVCFITITFHRLLIYAIWILFQKKYCNLLSFQSISDRPDEAASFSQMQLFSWHPGARTNGGTREKYIGYAIKFSILHLILQRLNESNISLEEEKPMTSANYVRIYFTRVFI